jgi:hypothetical protein
MCHDDQATARAAGKHAHVACEACHGPWRSTPTTPRRTFPNCPTSPTSAAAATKRTPPSRRASRRWSPPSTPAAWPATAATNRTIRTSEGKETSMDISRRDLFKVGGKLLVLASVGATLEQITGAEPASDAYRMADHWWGMIIDIDKCIGCGNCVRACSRRTACPGLLPHLGGALPDRRRQAAACGIARRRHGRLPAATPRPT